MARTTRKATKPAKARKAAKKAAAPEARMSKQAMLIEMLTSVMGATVAEIAKALAWQPHTVRGAISGALRKRLGLDVTSETVEGRGRVYRIAD